MKGVGRHIADCLHLLEHCDRLVDHTKLLERVDLHRIGQLRRLEAGLSYIRMNGTDLLELGVLVEAD